MTAGGKEQVSDVNWRARISFLSSIKKSSLSFSSYIWLALILVKAYLGKNSPGFFKSDFAWEYSYYPVGYSNCRQILGKYIYLYGTKKFKKSLLYQ